MRTVIYFMAAVLALTLLAACHPDTQSARLMRQAEPTMNMRSDSICPTDTLYTIDAMVEKLLKENQKLRQLYGVPLALVILTIAISFAAYHQYNGRKKTQMVARLRELELIYAEQQQHEALLSEEKQQRIAAFRQSTIYNKFHEAASGMPAKIDESDWQTLMAETDRCYNGFSNRLRAIHPVSQIELKISLLIKINVNVTGIALLTGRSKSAIVSARKSLLKKVTSETGKPEDLDNFLRSL